MKCWLTALRKYAVFSGRSRRREYWYFCLFSFVCGFLCAVLDISFDLVGEGHSVGPITFAYRIAVIVPTIAVSVRRLHDVGKSGSLLFMGLVPVLGGIWLLVQFCSDSVPGENEYGANPKGQGIAEPPPLLDPHQPPASS